MLGLFRKKITVKEIIISSHGFHMVWNYCRDNFDHRLHDDYSNALYLRIMNNLIELLKNDSNENNIYNSILNEIEIISPNGSPRNKFIEVAQKFANHSNNAKSVDFKTASKLLNETKFTITNIEESIKKGREEGSFNKENLQH